MNLTQRFVRSGAFRSLETIVSVASGLYLMPFLLNKLGQEQYGLWVLVVSVTSAFYIFDLGFAASVTRFMATALGTRDGRRADQVISTAFVVYSLLAGLIVIATIISAWMVPVFQRSPSQVPLTRTLICITGLALAIEFPFKAYAGISTFHLRQDLMSIVRIVVKVAAVAVTILAVNAGYSLIAIAFVGLASSIASNVSFVAVARYLEPSIRVSREAFDSTTFRELAAFSAWIFLADSVRMLRDRGDLWITAVFLGTTVLAVYYAAIRLVDYCVELLAGALGMTTAIFSREVAESGDSGLAARIALFGRLNATASAFVWGGFLIFSLPFFELWVGKSLDASLCATIGIIAVTARLLAFISLPLSSALTAISAPKLTAYVSAAEAAISFTVIAAAMGVFRVGVVAAAIGGLVAVVIARGLLLPKLVASRLDFSGWRYAFTVLFAVARMAPFVAIMAVISWPYIRDATLAVLVIWVFAYCGAGVIYLVVAMPTSDAEALQRNLSSGPVAILLRVRSVFRNAIAAWPGAGTWRR